MRKLVFGVSDQVRHKPGCKATEDGWRLAISDLEVEGLYCPCSENKGADQLRGYCECEADLCLRFSHMRKAGFLITRLISYKCFLGLMFEFYFHSITSDASILTRSCGIFVYHFFLFVIELWPLDDVRTLFPLSILGTNRWCLIAFLYMHLY